MAFPPEIVDHILSFLQWDRASLKVCAEAHPFISTLAERHLYAHLTVQNYDSWDSDVYHPSDFLECVVRNPDIPKHVRSLRIFLSSLHESYHELELILSAVTRLEAILLLSAFGWDLHESFRTAFINCLRLPTLTDVKILNVPGFPLSALARSSSLKRLSLSGDFSYSVPSPVYPPLDSLILHRCSSAAVEIIATWVESRSLRSLELDDMEAFSRLLQVCANTVTTLKVHVRKKFYARYCQTTPMPFSLACLPHLTRLTIQSSVAPEYYGGGGVSHDSVIPAIMHLLNTLPSPPTNLVCLVIGIDFINFADMDWSPLVSFPHFDVIPRIELRVSGAQKWGAPIPLVELLKTLKQDPHLMQLEKHRSFLIDAVDRPLECDEF